MNPNQFRLTRDDIADIVRILPLHGGKAVCEHLGCSRNTVTEHARKLGIMEWPAAKGIRQKALRARDVPGVAKVCTKCDELKPLSEFTAMKTGLMGRHSNCKACRKTEPRS